MRLGSNLILQRPASQANPVNSRLPSFRDWLPIVSPEFRWDWPHLRLLQEKCQRIIDGKLRRLAIFMPPQHGKSEQVTVRLPAFALERNPKIRVAVGSYNQTHANKFSRKTRRIVRGRVRLSTERRAVGEWETEAGGHFQAVGVGAGITGNPADLIIVDDPIKSREEADSEVYRNRVFEWFTEDIYSRKSKDCPIILIFTRWHEDDLWGRLSGLPNAADWEVLTLRAEAEADDVLARELGTPLCPDLHPAAELADNRKTMGSAYEGLYQCRPVKRGGDLIKRGWFPLVGAVPRQAVRVRYWDKAGTEDNGAFSCGILQAKTADGLYWIEDVVRGQWSINERNRIMEETAKWDRVKFGHVTNWVEQEPGSGGKESAEITVRQFAGYSIKVDPVRHDKLTRALPFADQAEAGNIRILQAAWTEALLTEFAAFPRGKYRDQVDAATGGFNKLALMPVVIMQESISSGGGVMNSIPKGVFG